MNPFQKNLGKNLDWYTEQCDITVVATVLKMPFPLPKRDDHVPLSGLQSSARKGWSSVFLGLHRGDKGHLLENGL